MMPILGHNQGVLFPMFWWWEGEDHTRWVIDTRQIIVFVYFERTPKTVLSIWGWDAHQRHKVELDSPSQLSWSLPILSSQLRPHPPSRPQNRSISSHHLKYRTRQLFHFTYMRLQAKVPIDSEPSDHFIPSSYPKAFLVPHNSTWRPVQSRRYK